MSTRRLIDLESLDVLLRKEYVDTYFTPEVYSYKPGLVIGPHAVPSHPAGPPTGMSTDGRYPTYGGLAWPLLEIVGGWQPYRTLPNRVALYDTSVDRAVLKSCISDWAVPLEGATVDEVAGQCVEAYLLMVNQIQTLTELVAARTVQGERLAGSFGALTGFMEERFKEAM